MLLQKPPPALAAPRLRSRRTSRCPVVAKAKAVVTTAAPPPPPPPPQPNPQLAAGGAALLALSLLLWRPWIKRGCGRSGEQRCGASFFTTDSRLS